MNDTKEIHYELELEADPSAVYQAILSSEDHTKFTGSPAEIEAVEGSAFSTFNGAISGTVEKLKKNELITMNWRAGAFPEGYFTSVKFELKETDKGTKVIFTHSGVPAEAADMINEGWNTNYWKKLPEYFSS